MANQWTLSDADSRRIGETTFDRNVVVLAGAGTGKTTLLVNRILHALLREPHPFRLPQMLALTFTNKAANEMKGRLRERLHELLAACQVPLSHQESANVILQDFQDRYHLSTENIREKVGMALQDIEKSHIATLHSFAAHILRLYPLECGVDPQFQEDDGTQFLEMFNEAWNQWLDEALGEHGVHHVQWREILDVVDLNGIRAFALALCDDQVSLQELRVQLEEKNQSPALVSWLEGNKGQIAHLLERYSSHKPRKIEKMLAVSGRVFDRIGQDACGGIGNLEEKDTLVLSSVLGQAPKGWTPDDFQEAQRLVRTAQRLLHVNEELLRKTVCLLTPFVEQMCRTYGEKGWIRFDGLIVRVRNVLRDYPRVREQLKQDFLGIMVDEFQDTDPLQYEILLYLSERLGQHGREWNTIQLLPGKLFIVGDPKQSIYAFRRADIQAFDLVVRKIAEDGGVVCTLATNFRSDHSVLEVVNAVFDRVFVQEDHVQPPNVPLMVGRREEETLSAPGVELYVLANDGKEEWDIEQATRVEAEWLASWIHMQLASGEQWVLEDGCRIPMRPGHVAVLFRKFTNAHVYLEAMHRRGVPFLTDGERHFYRRQEVIDLVNVLRVFDDPSDGIAIVGILRSSLGGVPDWEIGELARLGPLDIRQNKILEAWPSSRQPIIRNLFAQLTALQAQVHRLPLSEFIDRVFVELPILELAAASSHGEQAVMNIWKLRDLMAEQAAMSPRSYSSWVTRLRHNLITRSPEPEAALVEDSIDAVRILSIHKAKGLEFPVVVLPGLHHKSSGVDRGPEVAVDWMSGVYGCTFPHTWNTGQVFLWEKERIREKAEQRRVMYVGMTRARDRLILSGGRLTKPISESFFGFLQNVADREIGNPEHERIQIGEVCMRQNVVTANDLPPVKSQISSRKSEQSVRTSERVLSLDHHQVREKAWQQTMIDSAYLTPSLLHPSQANKPFSQMYSQRSRSTSQHLGSLVHQLLEQWNFYLTPKNFRNQVREFFQKRPLLELGDDEKKSLVLEIEELMETFLRSASYLELQQAIIIGREIPFVMPWASEAQGGVDAKPRVLEGVMDIVYEIAGDLWVGDYKTDRVTASNIVEYAKAYRRQAQAYMVGASRSLGREVKGCKLFFLRIGEVVTVLADLHTYS